MQSALGFSVDEGSKKKKEKTQQKKRKESAKDLYLRLWLTELENVLENVLYLAVDLQQDASVFKYSA